MFELMHDVITADDLERELMGKRRWVLKWADAVVAETEKAYCFQCEDERGRYRRWVPKSACTPVDYHSRTRASGAFKMPFRFGLRNKS